MYLITCTIPIYLIYVLFGQGTVIIKRSFIFFFSLNCVSQVKSLKQKIEKEKGPSDYSAVQQKLIYAGKILGMFPYVINSIYDSFFDD